MESKAPSSQTQGRTQVGASLPSGPPVDYRLEKAFNAKNGEKVKALFDGDISGYGGDSSRADQALCGMLAFYSSNDPDILDGMFRRSKLIRPKWSEKHYSDGRTYGEATVEKALDVQEDFYQWD